MPEVAGLSTPVRVSDQSWPDGAQPTVSVLCLAYNHGAYIAQAIEGFLIQETTFPVEILIHDDASTDETSSIIRHYASRYPRVIRPIIQTENQHSQGRWAIPIVAAEAAAPFWAICEGDDYWTAPDKLQLQVELLQANPKASGSVHCADGLFENSGELIPGYFKPYVMKEIYGVDDILVRGNFVPTHSIVLRKEALKEFPEWLGDVPHCDITLLCMAALEGPLLYIDRSMGVYRKHDGGIHTRDHSVDQHLKNLRTYFKMGEKLGISERDSFREGLRYSMGQIQNQFKLYEARIAELEARNEYDRLALEGVFKSKAFRIGLALSRVRDKILSRHQ
ncbi:MAG: glycosyltransferase [Gemmatimonadales bacterium]